MYCEKCKKDVVIYGVNFQPGIDEELDQMREQMHSEGKLILFNPLPFGPYNCPVCNTRLKLTDDD